MQSQPVLWVRVHRTRATAPCTAFVHPKILHCCASSRLFKNIDTTCQAHGALNAKPPGAPCFREPKTFGVNRAPASRRAPHTNTDSPTARAAQKMVEDDGS